MEIGISIRQMLSWNRQGRCLRCGKEKEHGEMFCTICQEEIKRIEREVEEQKRKEYLLNEKEVLARTGVPERYLEAEWSQAIVRGAEKIKAIIQQGDCFYFYGLPGSGKTYTAVCAMREWLREEKGKKEEKAQFVILPELFGNMRRYGKAQAYIQMEIARKKILILDELGVSENDFTIEILYNIINYRYNRPGAHFKTIITSNLTLDEVRDKMHDRMSSRINEMAKIIQFPKEDLRVKIKKEKT